MMISNARNLLVVDYCVRGIANGFHLPMGIAKQTKTKENIITNFFTLLNFYLYMLKQENETNKFRVRVQNPPIFFS